MVVILSIDKLLRKIILDEPKILRDNPFHIIVVSEYIKTGMSQYIEDHPSKPVSKFKNVWFAQDLIPSKDILSMAGSGATDVEMLNLYEKQVSKPAGLKQMIAIADIIVRDPNTNIFIICNSTEYNNKLITYGLVELMKKYTGVVPIVWADWLSARRECSSIEEQYRRCSPGNVTQIKRKIDNLVATKSLEDLITRTYINPYMDDVRSLYEKTLKEADMDRLIEIASLFNLKVPRFSNREEIEGLIMISALPEVKYTKGSTTSR